MVTGGFVIEFDPFGLFALCRLAAKIDIEGGRPLVGMVQLING